MFLDKILTITGCYYCLLEATAVYWWIMAEIIDIQDRVVNKAIRPIIDRGWLFDKEVDGKKCYGLTDEGRNIVISVIQLMYLESEAWKRPEYASLHPQEAGVAFAQEILSEEPFGGSPVLFMAIMGERIHEEFGITSANDAEYLLNISKTYTDYGKNPDPVD